MPFSPSRSRSGCQTASARVRGGWPGVCGSGAQNVANRVSGHETGHEQKRETPAEVAGDDHEHGAREHRRRAIAEGARRGGQARARSAGMVSTR